MFRTARSGKAENLPYSLSRWTDLPATKWAWFEAQLAQGWMVGFDPRTAVPSKWSLAPEDVLGLIFWTRNPRNLIDHADQLKPYPLVVHMTVTGWHEVEHGAPNLHEGLRLLTETVDKFGVANVEWRFSPVPAEPDVATRFEVLAEGAAQMGLKRVYVAFLQTNDLIVERRSLEQRQVLLMELSKRRHDLDVILCNEDRTLDGFDLPLSSKVHYGVCESGNRFSSDLMFDDCGCALAVDPFTKNEACAMGCVYCYAADKSAAPNKKDTTNP